MAVDIDKVKKQLRENGYFVFIQNRHNLKSLSEEAVKICNDNSYERGNSFRTNIQNFSNQELLQLVVNRTFFDIFSEHKCLPQDVFLTHEFKKGKSRNNYLHFDRLRCLKVLVYLQDVDMSNGPFSLVPKSHKKGIELRRTFSTLDDYEEKKNRIDIDYPHMEYNLGEIIGPAGTTIIFDSDIFHCGGNVDEGKERLVIRSHWYQDHNWRVTS
tara:strand:+ start:21053 stop:21691 length:639 start_codon:yes stop_codon:yes gene_type:complete